MACDRYGYGFYFYAWCECAPRHLAGQFCCLFPSPYWCQCRYFIRDDLCTAKFSAIVFELPLYQPDTYLLQARITDEISYFIWCYHSPCESSAGIDLLSNISMLGLA